MKQLQINYWLLLFISTSFVVAQDASNTPRFGASCGYLVNKIFCFGGAEDILTSIPSNTMHMLDLTTFIAEEPEGLSTKWVKLNTDTKTQNIQPRSNPQSAGLSDGKTLLIVGGDIYGNSSGVPQALSFNCETMTWNTYKNYEEPPFGYRQISDASSVYVPKYGLMVHGGIETEYNNSYAWLGEDISKYIDDRLEARLIGYIGLQIVDIRNTSNPWRQYELENGRSFTFPYRQAAIFDDRFNDIYFFGGSYYDTGYSRKTAFTFDRVNMFNFTTNDWAEKRLNGQPPSQRFGHTATVVGPNQRHVLIYGGQNDDSDRRNENTSFTYNYLTNVDSAIDPSNERLFGIETEFKLAENILILNVTNPLNITLINKLDDPSNILPTDTATETSTNTNTGDKGRGLTTSAIIGIAVGVSVAGISLIAFIILYIIKKKKSKTTEKEESLMEVDWEKIENEYKNPPAKYPEGHFKYLSQVPDDISSNEITQVSSSGPILSQDKPTIQNPDAIDHDEVNEVDIDQLQKPNKL
ncbi:hypothetical protein INT47_011222 [Mucor saturninus]|uniref:Galactose oxidase n=1 Tax=Mucor saturninus TaxID=64648 RepID=A0A8H7RNW0_9FUNG|nr:hypothetical protein INT47_011222 [Mucor saturninus]